MITYRTPCLSSTATSSPGSNSGTARPGRELQRGQHRQDPLLGRTPEVLLGEGEGVLIERNEVDLEVEPSRPDELDDLLQGCGRLPGLDPSDGRLTHAGAPREGALGQGATKPSLPYELPASHTPMIRLTYRANQPAVSV